MITKIETEFLESSNAIEGVYDGDSLNRAQVTWGWLKKKRELTPDMVLKAHKMLMLHQNIPESDKGAFRRCEVRIGGHYGLSYPLVSQAIEEWCKDVMTSLKVKENQEERFKLDHIRYETIHPFVDGNGRTGRMFWNWQRMRKKLPLIIIHEGEEQYEYYKMFR